MRYRSSSRLTPSRRAACDTFPPHSSWTRRIRFRSTSSLRLLVLGRGGTILSPTTDEIHVIVVIDTPYASDGQCAETTFEPGVCLLQNGNKKVVCR